MKPRAHVFRAPTVLVVDPEPSFRMLAAMLLRVEGCRVLAATSPEEAGQLIRQRPVVVDVLLINGDQPCGFDPAERFRERWPRLNVLYSFRHADDNPIARGVLPANATTLYKPDSLNSLCNLVRQWYIAREDILCDRLGVCPFSG